VILRIVHDLLELYLFVLIVRLVLTWFPIHPGSPWATLSRWLGKVTDPVLNPVRRLLPPISVGGGGFDLSPLIVFVVIEILLTVVR
jgi:YggT family protein